MPRNAVQQGMREAEETGQSYNMLEGTFRPRVPQMANKLGQAAGKVYKQRLDPVIKDNGVPDWQTAWNQFRPEEKAVWENSPLWFSSDFMNGTWQEKLYSARNPVRQEGPVSAEDMVSVYK
jgi:hypothetical protein